MCVQLVQLTIKEFQSGIVLGFQKVSNNLKCSNLSCSFRTKGFGQLLAYNLKVLVDALIMGTIQAKLSTKVLLILMRIVSTYVALSQ